MASYKSMFDPPNRPVDPTGNRRMGTYIQTGRPRQHWETDIAHISGQTEPRMGYPQVSRPQQTGLPRPSMREPSPSGRPVPEAKPSGNGSRFGFGKASSKAAPKESVPELRGKSSRNVLRRKPSSIAQNAISSRSTVERSGSTSPSKWSHIPADTRPSIEASLRSAEAYNEIFTRPRAKTLVTTQPPPVIPELDRYRLQPQQNLGSNHRMELPHKLSTQDLPPPTPLLSGTPLYSGSSSSHHRYSGYSGSGYSASPSTRFSESPGPGAAYSRDTTPTSMSSQSPSIIAPVKPNTPRLRQGSPALLLSRPPLTRRRAGSTSNDDGPVIDPQGLPSLRESLTSSSSNSTVKGENKAREKKKKKRLSPLPPSPPPRKSSQKFKKPRSDTHESPSKSSQTPARPLMTSPSDDSPSMTKRSPSRTRDESIPPRRPSREDTPDLQSQLGESIHIIQSNLAGLHFSQEREQSGLPHVATTSPSQAYLTPRLQQSSRIPSRNPSPSPAQPSPREATPPSGLGIIPDLRHQKLPASSKSPAFRTPSPSIANPKPRFGLFGRRTKTLPEISTADNKDRASRKGPAAGTGHEGYGRYALRGRSSSAGGLTNGRERNHSAASSSQDSISSTRTHDPFLLERMSPVIITGGGEVIENRNINSRNIDNRNIDNRNIDSRHIDNRNASPELIRTESNTSLQLERPSMDSKVLSKSSLGQAVSRTTLWPSALPKEPSSKRSSTLVVPKNRRPSDSSDDGIGESSSAFRRSIQRPNGPASALQFHRPLNVTNIGPQSSVTTLDASIMSDKSQLDVAGELATAHKGQITKAKKLDKRPKSPRKWNFFHRQPKTGVKAEAQISVAVGRAPIKPIPHYALLDSSDEQVDYMEGMDLEDIIHDADVIDLSNEELDLLQFGESKENLRRNADIQTKITTQAKEERPTPILFSSPEPFQVTPEIPATQLHLTKVEAPIRPSRLPQVGRIPKVVSARPQATSPKSFSRPFARLSTAQPLLPIILDKDSIALGPSPSNPSTPEPPRDFQAEIEANLRKGSTDSRSDATAASHPDFFAFSPRKNSEVTTSSSGTISFVGTTAVIPEADAELAEDEVWDEYDDLIRTEDKVPVSATSSHGVPFQYESYETRRIRKSKSQAKESPTITAAPKIEEPSVEDNQLHRSILTTSSFYSQDMSPRLNDTLMTIPTPTTPMSFTDFFSGYGDRNNSIHGDSIKKPRRASRSSSSSHSRSNSGLVTITEQESNSPLSQVNLRVGSMTVSKWLTFSHVLFSPAREATIGSPGQTKRQSILVIDGLGNDDWSFYAAETYPSATFYNLSPTRPLSASQRNSTSTSFPLTPPNHRQVQYLSPTYKFPFPSSTFHVVVFRFPNSMTDASYRNIISESKRVLQPGGYLEMGILDLDMMNMGNRARRAVRGLKVRMQQKDPATNLGSASDTMLRIVGRRGFVDVKSCNVGVPVASAIHLKGGEEELSLADMMKDSSAAGDESITKMVAKVGRWWYNRCYESGDPTNSIFNDGGLLRESKKWNTSFKLVVAYAQKPVVGRRRTLSV